MKILETAAIGSRLSRHGITAFRIKQFFWGILRFCLLFGLSFIIIYPFIAKISSTFMSKLDLYDPIVWIIPRRPTLVNIQNVIKYGSYLKALKNTSIISVLCAVFQTFSATLVGYGFAKFKFRGKNLFLLLTVLTIVIPPSTIYVSLYTKFRYFDWFGVLHMMGITPPNFVESFTPMVLLSTTSLGLKNGLYILVLMQIFRGIPKELSEAAYVDGAGIFRTFWQINMPQARSMMVSLFMLSFAWQWTDTFYSGLYFKSTPIMQNVISAVRNISEIGAANDNVISATMINTAVMMAIFPLIILYLFGQKMLIQGVERSGMVG